jgi:hypothetical protein
VCTYEDNYGCTPQVTTWSNELLNLCILKMLGEDSTVDVDPIGCVEAACRSTVMIFSPLSRRPVTVIELIRKR